MDVAQELEAVLCSVAAEHHVPGAAAAVVVGDDVHVACYGTTNAEFPQDVAPGTLFQVGSVTKTFTSSAVMLLAEEGLLSLDDPVAKHLPALGSMTGLDAEALTIERLLSHQSGFDGDHLFVTGAVHTTDDLAALATTARLFEPGAGVSYNNAAFSIMGAVIEAASGTTFVRFVRDRFLRPLGLRGATFVADEAITYSVAAPHWVHDGKPHVLRGIGWQTSWELGVLDRPAGGLVASAEHLAAWGRFQWTGSSAEGDRVLSAEGLARLHRPIVRLDDVHDLALDWFVRDVDGVRTIGHGGVTVGYVSDLTVVPEHQVAIVGLTNAVHGAVVVQAVRRWALDHLVGVQEQDSEPDPSRTTVDPGVLGRYVHSFGVLTITEGEAPGTVLATSSHRDDVDGWQPPAEPPVTLGFVSDDHAVSIDGAGPVRIVRFGLEERGADGAAPWLVWGGRRALRADR